MALPLILVGVAALSGYGIKKGVDAKRDFNRAESLNNEAQSIFDNASAKLEFARNQAQIEMDGLGRFKFEIYESRLIPFVEAFSKIKHVDFQDRKLIEEFKLAGITKNDLLAIEKSALEMKEVVGSGITALGAGGLAGLAAYGGAGLVGAASTGTAITALSGVAATNATLAWLGGGSLAAGGFGMAGGVAVLGGIVAGPVLAIGGMMLASKAAEAKENAYANLDRARAAVEEMKTALVATQGIQKRFEEIAEVLYRLDQHFVPLLSGLQAIVRQSTDYRTYSVENRQGIMMAAALAKTIKNVMEAPLLDQDGRLTVASRAVLGDARQQLLAIAQA